MKILQVKEITNLLDQVVTRVGSEGLFVQTRNTAVQYDFAGKFAVACSITQRTRYNKVMATYATRQDMPAGELWWKPGMTFLGNRKFGYVILRDAQALSIEYDGVEYITYPEE